MTTGSASGDPVRVLLHRHRTLCERAVDPLEIAAGLEAGGITDRTVAQCRHRDVFSLAEELYARTPYRGARPPHTGDGACGASARRAPSADTRLPRPPGAAARRLLARCAPLVLPLLPGLLCAGTLAWWALLRDGPAAVRVALCVLGALTVPGSAVAVLRAVPRVPRVPRAVGTAAFSALAAFPALCVCWLAGYALYGDWLLAQLLGGGPDASSGAPRMPSPALPLALALAVAPVVWGARGFASAARRRLAGSRSLEDFAAAVRPLLAWSVCAVAVALPVLHLAARALVTGPLAAAAPGPQVPWPAAAAATGALGLLLFAALLLAAHGFRRAASAGLAAACAGEAAALLSVPVARLPGLGALGRPPEALVAHLGTAAVPVAACGCAALVLLAYAAGALANASAHHRGGGARMTAGPPPIPPSGTGLRTRPCDTDKEQDPMIHAQLAHPGTSGRRPHPGVRQCRAPHSCEGAAQ
ncbi:hypothetical protein [Streptomyces qinglanensis]|uniref:hypothetical protein n=1 Tax=Streptomyces qinglanensis TaxID=943816 RepID=UPI003D736311